MYIWVVLSAFLAILASYTLSARSDYRKLTVEPVAEAVIAKIVTKHKAAMSYVRYRKAPYTANATDVTYNPGVINDSLLTQYFPVGHINSEEFTSQIFCLSNNLTTSNNTQAACEELDNRKMLITYGEIPVRWINPNTEVKRPNIDFMNAMRNSIDSATPFGYTAPTDDTSSDRNPSGSNLRLVDRDYDDVYVPLAIVNDSNFKTKCDISQDKVCIVYQSFI